MFNREAVRGLILGFLLGGVSGYFVAHRIARSAPDTPLVAAPIPPQPGVGLQSHIFEAQRAVQADPGNTAAWVALGNGYFDSGMPAQAVEAYAKALALAPDNPDVLTDQGVMYRELKAYDKAIANWEKAQRIDPRHLQSLYNLGVVYAHDLNRPDRARKAWTRLVEIAPGSPQASQAREGLALLGGQDQGLPSK